mmetsp:Transcript_29867/g.82007  ORF Transcript_29867/g.82007 Transcript_29867/m.82007 type:complete len:128 (+) Transcript_29867:355-738(+)
MRIRARWYWTIGLFAIAGENIGEKWDISESVPLDTTFLALSTRWPGRRQELLQFKIFLVMPMERTAATGRVLALVLIQQPWRSFMRTHGIDTAKWDPACFWRNDCNHVNIFANNQLLLSRSIYYYGC